MNPQIISAVQEKTYWLENFTRQHYARVFQEFSDQFVEIYLAELQNIETEKALEDFAAEFINELEKGWHCQLFWKRTRVKFDEQQVIVTYLNPMLLELEDPRGVLFAEQLQKEWARRWPRDAYHLSSFSKIKKGFRNEYLGFSLPEKKEKKKEDD